MFSYTLVPYRLTLSALKTMNCYFCCSSLCLLTRWHSICQRMRLPYSVTQLLLNPMTLSYSISLHNYQYIHASALGLPNSKYFQSISSISFSLVSLGFLVVQLLFCSIFFHLLQILIPSFARQCPASGINWFTARLISPFFVFIIAVFPSRSLITS